MKKIIFSLSVVAVVAAVAVGATTAFFNDTEVSTGNTFTAGAIDLTVDNTSYYNGEFNEGTSWTVKDLELGDYFFNFLDLKPGDWGEDTISLHVDSNDAWACMDISLTATDDNGLTEPEGEDGDVTGGLDEGELQDQVHFIWWADDGDNVLEEDEEDSVFSQTLLSDLDDYKVALADSTGTGVLSSGPLTGLDTYYVGKAWCFGDFVMTPEPQDGEGYTGDDQNPSGTNGPDVRNAGISCDGSSADNTAQTDSVEGDVSFMVIQSRNNPDFLCEGGGISCLDKADVMLVLDRSGSVGSDEGTLESAAKAFVDALGPTSDGVHIGVVSFAGGSSLDMHLSDDATALKAAIDAGVSGGGTNLAAGISTADTELDNPGDGDDRDDSSSPDFMVIITDGAPNIGGTGEAEADAAKADGIEIFAVGVGSGVDETFLKDHIVSPPADGHYFDAIDFSDLEDILEDIASCSTIE
jgi:predicted ribosomally synthesized peptide with SipW-like signal peptide